MATARRGWRWRRVVLVAIALLLGLLLALHWLLQPEQLGRLLIAELQQRSGLQIELARPARLGFWPGLQLHLDGLEVRTPDQQTLLQAERLALRLPLSVLWSELQVGAIQLDQPTLDLDVMQEWIAADHDSGPPAALELPAIDDLSIRDASLRSAEHSWRLPLLQLRNLRPGRALELSLQVMPDTNSQTPSEKAGDESDAAQLQLQLQLQAQVIDTRNGLQLEQVRMRAGSPQQPEALQLAGEVNWNPPSQLDLNLSGELQQWPNHWPSPESSLSGQLQHLPLQLQHQGPADLSGTLHLRAEGQRGRLQASLQLPLLLQWLDTGDWSAPLPIQLQAELDALELDGVRIEGIRIEHEVPPES